MGDAEIDFIPVDGLNLQTWTTIIRLRRQMTLQVELRRVIVIIGLLSQPNK